MIFPVIKRNIKVLLCAAAILVAFNVAFAEKNDHRMVRMKVSENRLLSKGGIGIIHQDLYVDLKSDRNELIVGRGRWKGGRPDIAQVVFVSDDRVVELLNADDIRGFALGQSVVVSFEGKSVYFFDFKSGVGGYYDREP